jgi:hypothetical protein
MVKEGCEPEKIGISLGGTPGKDKTTKGNLYPENQYEFVTKGFFIRGVSKISDDFGQQLCRLRTQEGCIHDGCHLL